MRTNLYLIAATLLTMLFAACTTKQGLSTVQPSNAQGDEQTSSQIAYIAWRGGERSLYVWDMEAHKEVKLTDDLEELESKFSWSPDGTQIVFQGGFRYEQSELYTVNVQNGELERLTENDTLDENPDWSPCGDWIAFASGVDASGGYKLWLINPDSHERKTVINDPSIQFDTSFSWPIWSPDAAKIAVITPMSPATMAWDIIDVSSGHQVLLIKHEGAEVGLGPNMAAWHPNGKEFAYSSNQRGTFDIYVQAVESNVAGEPKRLTELSCNSRAPVWHPDKAIILFTCLYLDESEQIESQLYTVDVETLEIRQLTDEGNSFWGDWSPDGERIAFSLEQDGAHYLAVMNADGSNIAVLEETRSDDIWMPKWAPMSGPRCDHTPLAAAAGLTPPAPAVVILAPDVSGTVDPIALATARDVLQRRLDSVVEGKAQVIIEGSNLRVELSSADDVSSTARFADQVGALAFFDSADLVGIGTSMPSDAKAIVTDADISRAQATFTTEGEWVVWISLTPEGVRRMAEHTKENIGRFLVIAHDGFVILSPRLQAPIVDGQAFIGGDLDQTAAQSLAVQLNSGRLPFRLVVTQVIE